MTSANHRMVEMSKTVVICRFLYSFSEIVCWFSMEGSPQNCKIYIVFYQNETVILCPESFAQKFFPQQRKLGSSAIVKVPEQVGAAKSARRRVGNRVPRKGFLFQENPSEQPNPHGARLGTGFPGRGSQARFPGRGSQARSPSKVPRTRFPRKVPGTGSQARGSQARFPGTGFPSKVPTKRLPGTQSRFLGKVTRNRFSSKGSQQDVPKQGFQEEVTKRKVFRKRFPGKVPKRFQARFPGTGSQARVPRQGFPARGSQARGSQEEVPKGRFSGRGSQAGFRGRGFQEQVPKQGSQEQVLQARISGTVFKVSRNRFTSKISRNMFFPKQNKVPRTCFQASASRKRFKRCPSKVPSKFPKQDFQEHVFQAKTRFPEQVFKQVHPGRGLRGVQARFPASFPSKISRNMFSKQKQDSQNRFSNKWEVSKQQARFPAGWFPSNVFRKKFPSKVPSHRFPGTGARTRFSRTGSQVRFPSAFPSKVPRKRFPSKVPSNRFPGTGSQTSFPRTGSQVRVPEKAPRQYFQEKAPKQGCQEQLLKQGC